MKLLGGYDVERWMDEGRKFYRRSIGYMGLSCAVMCGSVCTLRIRNPVWVGRIVCRYPSPPLFLPAAYMCVRVCVWARVHRRVDGVSEFRAAYRVDRANNAERNLTAA